MLTPGRHVRRALLGIALALLATPARRAAPEPAPEAPDASRVRATANRIDDLVAGRLRRLGIASAPVCDDATFVRRASLDVIGTLPTAEEARAFLVDRSPDRRRALVERLLARDEFADYWAMKWCNLLRVKSEFPINLWPNAVQAYHHWIRASIRQGMPYDRFARELLTASGSNFRVPQVNFWRAVQSREPASLARAVALTFMGARADAWPKERLAGMAAFFARIGYKATAEWKEEIVFFDLAKADAPSSGTLPDGVTVKLSADRDPREVFADWLIDAKNPWFARSIANRVWSWFLGTGIVHEPDDLRPDNPPTNPELLALLERELIAAKYDLKSLFRLVLTSKTYQRACVPASSDPRGVAEFAWYPVRRLEPEVLIDAINQVTGTSEEYTSKIPEPFTIMPTEQRAIALPDASVTSPFLELFGRSPRDTGLESEQRDNLPTSAQALHLLNSTHVRRKLEEGPGLRALAKAAKKPRDAVDALYLATVSRFPTAEELSVLEGYKDAGAQPWRVGLDLAWALINSAEFQYRH